jgi:hypothetical protein
MSVSTLSLAILSIVRITPLSRQIQVLLINRKLGLRALHFQTGFFNPQTLHFQTGVSIAVGLAVAVAVIVIAGMSFGSGSNNCPVAIQSNSKRRSESAMFGG